MVAGKRISGPGPDRGVIFQKDAVFPWMRVDRNVEYGMKVRGVDRKTRDERVAEYLGLVGLSGVARSWPRELSGGMRTRVAIASVFANDPTILLADEPFGALDFVTRRQLQGVILDMWERTAKTVIFVTHDVDEALMLASRILVIGHGRVVEDQAVILPRPRNEDVLGRGAAIEAPASASSRARGAAGPCRRKRTGRREPWLASPSSGRGAASSGAGRGPSSAWAC
jgi:NitT/TauT family transport system ATP-binding protein